MRRRSGQISPDKTVPTIFDGETESQAWILVHHPRVCIRGCGCVAGGRPYLFANLCEMALVAHIRLTWRTIGEEAPSRAKKEASSFVKWNTRVTAPFFRRSERRLASRNWSKRNPAAPLYRSFKPASLLLPPSLRTVPFLVRRRRKLLVEGERRWLGANHDSFSKRSGP